MYTSKSSRRKTDIRNLSDICSTDIFYLICYQCDSVLDAIYHYTYYPAFYVFICIPDLKGDILLRFCGNTFIHD